MTTGKSDNFWQQFGGRFENLSLPQRGISNGITGGYRVYKNADDFVDVEASLVSEAIEKSGIISPYKIERIGVRIKNIIEPSALKQKVGNVSDKAAKE